MFEGAILIVNQLIEAKHVFVTGIPFNFDAYIVCV